MADVAENNILKAKKKKRNRAASCTVRTEGKLVVQEASLRSRSISRVLGEAVAMKESNVNKNHSHSPSSDKVEKRKKKKKGPISLEDIENDDFLKTVESILKKNKMTSLIDKNKELQLLLKDASEALEKSLAKKASEMYSIAFDTVVSNLEAFAWKEIDLVLLKYSLSISWIATEDYNDIIKSIECLTEIEARYSARLPAVYYGLGKAFCKLNRFKNALQHLEKGMKIIEREVKFPTHSWPGTMNPIIETTRSGLSELLVKLIFDCKIYKEPDAVCRHKNCLEISSHILPSQMIFYSDPDYIGHVIIICEVNCRIAFHIGCWKHYKEIQQSESKLCDKDVTGRQCITSDCITKDNRPSVIVRIEVYGFDGKMKSHSDFHPIKSVSIVNKETKKCKKEKREKSTDNSSLKVKSKNQCRIQAESSLHNTGDALSPSGGGVHVINTMSTLRKKNFGYAPNSGFSPGKPYSGLSDVADIKQFFIPEVAGEREELCKERNAIFMIFYDLIKREGPQEFNVVESKWEEELSKFNNFQKLVPSNYGICKFLLQSLHFAAIDGYLCLASQLPAVHDTVCSMVDEQLHQLLTFEKEQIRSKTHLYQHDVCDDTNTFLTMSDMYYSDNEFEEEEIILSVSDFLQSEECHKEQNVEVVEKGTNNGPENINGDTSKTPPPDMADEVVLELAQPVNTTMVYPMASPRPSVVSNEIQTETEHEYGAIKSMMTRISAPKNDLMIYKESNEQRERELHREKKKLQETVKACEKKLVSLEHQMQALRSEIAEKDTKMGSIKKKHAEEIAKLNRKLEGERAEGKKQLNIIAKITKKNEDLEIHLKEEQNQTLKLWLSVLHTKKDLADHQLSVFRQKCIQNLVNMNSMLKHLSNHTYPTLADMKKAINQWKHVTDELDNIGLRLQDRYNLVKKEKVINKEIDFLIEKLPVLPHNPMDDLENMMKMVLAHQHLLSSGELGGGDTNVLHPQARAYVPGTSIDDTLKNMSTTGDATSMFEKQYFLRGQNLQFMNNVPVIPAPHRVVPTISFGSQNYQVPPVSLFPSALPLSGFQTKDHTMVLQPPMTWNSSATVVEMGAKAIATETRCGILSPKKLPVNNKSDTVKVPAKTNKSSPVPFSEVKEERKSSSGLIPIVSCMVSDNLENKDSPQQMKGLSSYPKVIFQPPKSATKPKVNTNVKPSTAHPRSWNYQMLLAGMQHSFRGKSQYEKIFVDYKSALQQEHLCADDNFFTSRVELMECLMIAREQNKNHLSGLPVQTIYSMVEKILKERSNKKCGTMGMDKFLTAPWGGVQNSECNWKKPEEENEECTICSMVMTLNVLTLPCNHKFHSKCIHTWFDTHRTCPLCRKYTIMNDEYPTLPSKQ